MALINCTECDKEISDKAKTCPNCGIDTISEVPYHPPLYIDSILGVCPHSHQANELH